MLRYGLIAGWLFVAACASAGSGSSSPPPDARPSTDAPRPDSGLPADAPVDLCPSTVTCGAATSLGQIRGDVGGDRLTAMGHQAAWFRVRVTEANTDPLFGYSLRGLAKLTSPAGVDFDVIVYLNEDDDEIECLRTVGDSTANGPVNETRVEWGEGGDPNGIRDDRHLTIEVRPISGACDPSKQWQLEIEGNWD